MAKGNRKSGIVTIIIILIIAAGIVGIFLTLRPGAQVGDGVPAGTPNRAPGGALGGRPTGRPGGGEAVPGTAVELKALELGSVSTFIRTTGEISLKTRVEIFPDTAGKIVEYRVKEGDRIASGAVIAMVDPSKPGDSYSASPVTAPIGGTIISTPGTRGERVSTQSSIAVIADLSSLRVETLVPERYAGSIRIGVPAILGFEAWPGETFSAKVSRIGATLDASSRTLPVSLTLDKPEVKIKAGMFADIRLITASREEVPVIPREAVTTWQGEKVAFVVGKDNIAERRSLEIGLAGSDLFELRSGIAPGEMVVVNGQTFLEDGDLVRVISTAGEAE